MAEFSVRMKDEGKNTAKPSLPLSRGDAKGGGVVKANTRSILGRVTKEPEGNLMRGWTQVEKGVVKKKKSRKKRRAKRSPNYE